MATLLDFGEHVTREIAGRRYRWTRKQDDKERALMVQVDTEGVTVWGKGLQQAVTVPWPNIVAWAQRLAGRRQTSWVLRADAHRAAAKADAIRAITAAYPDRADQIIATLDL